MKVLATKHGRFSRHGEDLNMAPGDLVPAHLVEAAIANGWGREVMDSARSKKTRKTG